MRNSHSFSCIFKKSLSIFFFFFPAKGVKKKKSCGWARWTSKLPPNLKCHEAKTAAITLLHNSNYEEAGHLQKHSQSLIKYILIKKYAKTIREKIIKLVVKGYTYFPLTWNFMNKARNEVKFKVKRKLLFIYFSLLGMILRKDCFQSLLLYNFDKYNLLMALYFSLKK